MTPDRSSRSIVEGNRKARRRRYRAAARFVPCIILLLLHAMPGVANETAEEPAGADEETLTTAEIDEELNEVIVDVQGSLEDVDDRRGISFDGDLRVGYLFSGDGFSDFDFEKTRFLRMRWRVGSTWRFAEGLRLVGRVAGLCSSDDCSADFIMQPNVPRPTTLEDGQVTFDELFLHWFRSDRFSVAVGRMETRFVTRGGVYSKSLERNDNNNLRVNWTDGLHAIYRASSGWNTHLILQHNSEDGPSNVRRFPLDFESSRSRVSYHLGFENLEPRRLMIQRGLTLSYLPSSLRRETSSGVVRDDYVGIVGRLGHRWPQRDEGWRIRSSLEVGYAPETHSKTQAGVIGDGPSDGLAWAVTASVMDFVPNHSIGLNYARTEAGWLLSPQYASNEELIEIRYMWRPNSRVTVDVRGRWRDELRELTMPEIGRDRFDFYARATWSFDIRDFSR